MFQHCNRNYDLSHMSHKNEEFRACHCRGRKKSRFAIRFAWSLGIKKKRSETVPCRIATHCVRCVPTYKTRGRVHETKLTKTRHGLLTRARNVIIIVRYIPSAYIQNPRFYRRCCYSPCLDTAEFSHEPKASVFEKHIEIVNVIESYVKIFSRIDM